MAHAKAVHRPLHLASPPLKSADVKALQEQINKRFRGLRIDREIAADSVLGAQTFKAAKQIALCLGVIGGARSKLERHLISEGTQKLIRGRKVTVAERLAAKARAPYRRSLRKRFAKSPGEEAIAKGLKLVGAHEVPDGSNWGGKVEQFIRFTGYTGPVYWCGCFACWVVCKLGGAKVPARIRMGYAPYITADALAGANGFTAVPVTAARPGDVGCLWDGEHVVTVREPVKPGDTMVLTLEGNTSASDGSQSNGGEVAAKERPIGDFDHGIVARPSW
jgi:hypothetical protein